MEVYVRPAAGGIGKWQISRDGGFYPHWSRDGRMIFFFDTSGALCSVAVETDGGAFKAGRVETLFHGPYVMEADGRDRFDVAPDGRFILVKKGSDGKAETHEHIRVVLSWGEELRRTFAGATAAR
jgi:hypothetical protein